MITEVSKKDWTETIFDLDFNRSFTDDGRFHDYLLEKMSERLPTEYPNHEDSPWHWKCPTSLLFLDTWLKIFPDAWYLHIKRDDFAVARSLLTRKQADSVSSALALARCFDDRLNKIPPQNFLSIPYEKLETSIDEIISFLPIQPSREQVEHALSAIHRPTVWWKFKRSLKGNFREAYVRLCIKAFRLRKGYSNLSG